MVRLYIKEHRLYKIAIGYLALKLEMRRCGVMLAFFIVILLIASHVMEDEESFSGNIEVAIEQNLTKVNRP